MVKCEAQLTVSVELSQVQVETLLFFAGRRDTPCGQTPTVQALSARGLLEPRKPYGFQISELGRQVAAQLDDTCAA